MPVLLLLGLVLNEICYDPDGPDGGAEFVEIINPGAGPLSLAGVSLEFANGAEDPPRWRTRWSASADASLAAGAVFLIVDRGWTGVAAQDSASLGLQNGPDAVRLLGPDGVLDLVGWGELAWPDLYEGEPAVDVAGASLARHPDGRDTDRNAADWREAEPTPGRANWAPFAPDLVDIGAWPPSLARPREPVTITLRVVNGGLAPLLAGRLEIAMATASGEVALPGLPAEASAEVVVAVTPIETGLLPLRAAVVAPTTADTARFDLGAYQVGLPEIRLSEVMAAPLAGGEWCEVTHAGSAPRSLAGLRLRDEDGPWRDLPAAELTPGSHLLLVADAAEFSAWLEELATAGAAPACAVSPPLELSGWPGLNNSAPVSRPFADCLYLGDAEGHVIDHLVLGAALGEAPEGRTLERGRDQRWRLATARAGGTPGCAAAGPGAPGDGRIQLAPNPFHPDDDPGGLVVAFTVPAAALGWELRIFDLWGQEVADLGGDELGPGHRAVVWDGRDATGRRVPGGGYVALLRWRYPGAAVVSAGRRLVVVGMAGR